MRSHAHTFRIDHRWYLLLAFFSVFFVVSLIKLFFIQVVDHGKYEIAAKDQHIGSTDVPAQRGNIYSSDTYLLAGTETYYLMFGEPKKISDKDALAEKLAKYTASQPYAVDAIESSPSASLVSATIAEREKEKLSKYQGLLNQDLFWVALEHNISPDQKAEIEKLNLVGIGFEEEPTRFYPESSLAAHVLGFVASNESGEKQGYYGLEGFFNENLKGRPGRVTQEVDPSGVPILIGDYKQTDAIPGSDLYSTIDRSVQYIVEKALKAGVEKYDAKSGTVIVMDPYTGDIIAMANYPTFVPSYFGEVQDDPNAYRKSIEYRNLAIAEMYEPGSVLKPLTIATGIESGLISEDTTYDDKGPVEYSGQWIDNWDHKHWGVLNIVQLLQKSNNIGAAWVGTKIGSRALYNSLLKFGMGVKSGVDLEGEDASALRDYHKWTDIDLANISFGQGILTTPLQVLNAFNVFANGGFLMRPRIVTKIVDSGKATDIPVSTIRRVISKQTSDRMVALLES